MAQTVVGFFDSASQAQTAVQQLIDNGFSRQNIDVSTGNANSGNISNTADNLSNTASNTGYTEGGSEHESGITRFFKSLFGDDNDEADRYSKVGHKSGSIVTVHAQSADEAERAADLLDDYGAINVNERASEYGYSGSGASDTTARENLTSGTVSDRASMNTGRENLENQRETSIPKIQEELQVGKRTVEGGGVRVRSRIIERPVEENVRLREEHVRVERNPVNRPATQDDLANFREGEIELTERTEVPVVNKQARVVEEVTVGKEVNERNETVRDTVRNTEVEVENLNKGETRENLTRDEDRTSYRDTDITNRDRDTDTTI